jgi:hypothetical protein
MMEGWDVGLLAAILAMAVSIPLLAQGCVLFAWWTMRREAESEERHRSEAKRRAHSLLREVLTENEYRQLREEGYLAVHSPNVAERTYRIQPSRKPPVDVYESGELVARLCVQPAMRLPVSDVLLVHKLMIEGDEPGYLREANVVEYGFRYRGK